MSTSQGRDNHHGRQTDRPTEWLTDSSLFDLFVISILSVYFELYDHMTAHHRCWNEMIPLYSSSAISLYFLLYDQYRSIHSVDIFILFICVPSGIVSSNIQLSDYLLHSFSSSYRSSLHIWLSLPWHHLIRPIWKVCGIDVLWKLISMFSWLCHRKLVWLVRESTIRFTSSGARSSSTSPLIQN